MKYTNKKQIINKTIKKNQLPLLEFASLQDIPWVSHCFTTKEGGCSKGMFESLNLSFTRGDDHDCVMENYRRVAEAMDITMDRIVTSDQTHTTNVRLVTEEDAGKGIIVPRDYTDIDGLITNVEGLLLATFYADCVPLYFVDMKNRAIGLSHSGWKGTVSKMGAVTIQKMKEAFGTNPEDLCCAIGPSICQDCYEVSEDVAEAFRQAFPNHVDELLLAKENNKYQLDLWKANEWILREAGVKEENIAVTNICTCCNHDVLFSHRATQGKRGNLGAFLMIRP